jgi:hypothetical protein
MPLAKSAPVETPITLPSLSLSDGVMVYNGLPLSVPNFFNVDAFSSSETETQRMNEIYSWARNKLPDGTLGDVMTEISKLERQLGSTVCGESRIDKMWRWTKLSNKIVDLEKERNALERRRLL